MSPPVGPDLSPEFWRGRRVALTGATGFLGTRIVQDLLHAGAVPIALRRTGSPATPPDDVESRDVDLTDGSGLAGTLRSIEAGTLVHLAAQATVGSGKELAHTYQVNVAGTWTLLDAATRVDSVTEVVVCSSEQAYGNQPRLPCDEAAPLLATHPYGLSKACADRIASSFAEVAGLPVAITRPSNLFGPGDRTDSRLIPGTIRRLLAGQPAVLRSDGTATRDFLPVADAARGHLLLVEALAADPDLRGTAVNLSSGRPISVLQLVDIIKAAVGIDTPTEVGQTSDEVVHLHSSPARALELLSWRPRHDLETAMQETVDWHRTSPPPAC